MKVLIIDESDNFSELNGILRTLGCKEIIRIFTEKEAVEKIRELEPDLIFLNISGEGSGADIANKIIKLKDIPVIYLAVFIKSCIVKSLQIPEDAVVLSKPLTAEKVKNCIKMALK